MSTPEQRLAALEACITATRWARACPEEPEHAHYVALKEMAAEIRGTEPAQVGRVLRCLADAVDRAKRERARLGFIEVGRMQHLTEIVTGSNWTTIRMALERFESNGDAR